MAERKRTAGKTSTKKEFIKIDFDALKVTRAFAFDNGNVAFDFEYEGIKFYGSTVVETKAGNQFISFPSYQNNGKWYSFYYMPLSDEDQEKIIDLVYDCLDD